VIESRDYIPSVDLSTFALGKNTIASSGDTTFAPSRGAISKILRNDNVTVLAFVDLVSCTHTHALFPFHVSARRVSPRMDTQHASMQTNIVTHRVRRIVRAYRTKKGEIKREKEREKEKGYRTQYKLSMIINVVDCWKLEDTQAQKNPTSLIR